jgi:uncharacterized protein
MAFGLATLSSIAGVLTARHASGKLIVGGIDILGALESTSVLAFGYTDNTSDQADDFAVEIADPHRTWMQSYLPKKGSEVQASIKVFNWTTPGDTREFDCGTFFIDEIEYAGPPNMVKIKATSIPVATGLKSQKKYRFWEDVPVQAIAAQVSAEHGLALIWDVAKSVAGKLKRVDQVEMPDLEFLRDLAKDWGIKLKIFNRQLVMYSEEEYEAKPPVYTMLYGAANIISYQFTSQLSDKFAKGMVAYVSPITGNKIEGEFVAPEKPEGVGDDTTNEDTTRVEDEDDGDGGDVGGDGRGLREMAAGVDYTNENAAAAEAAKQKAKSKLREKNKWEKEATILIVGDPGYISGLCVQLLGFGIFDGQWFIDSSRHSISEEGYVTELQMHMALKGY